MSDSNVIDLDVLVRSIAINRGSPHCLFLGAGASISSGMPSAQDCIWDWKRLIFSSNNPTLSEQVSELSIPDVRRRIDSWLVQQGHTPEHSGDEYGYYIEKAFPFFEDRRRYFQEHIRKARPHVGYDLLCLLARAELIRSVWTTNFDSFVAKAAADFDLVPVEIGLDTVQRTFRQPEKNEILCVAMHGDYRYDPLKNTSDELREQEASLVAAFKQTLHTHTLLVVGYSGRDASIMSAFRSTIASSKLPGKIFWCGYSNSPSEEIISLLSDAREAGNEAYYVAGVDFDDLMTRLSLQCLDGDNRKDADERLRSVSRVSGPVRKEFDIKSGNESALIKSNAWRLSVPSEAFEFDLKEWPETRVWSWIKELTAGTNVIAVPCRKVLALGTLDEIKSVFSDHIKGTVRRVPLTDRDLRYEDGAVMQMLRRALVTAIANRKELQSDRDRLLWMPEIDRSEIEGGIRFNVHKAAELAIRIVDGTIYLTIDPSRYIPTDSKVESEKARSLRTRILGYQHNHVFNSELNDWRKLLFKGEKVANFDFPPRSAAFEFKVCAMPEFATIQAANGRPISLPKSIEKEISLRGIQVQEPKLSFSSDSSSHRSTDTLPLRGLAQHGPFDQALGSIMPGEGIRVAVVCPKAESPFLESFLQRAKRSIDPKKGDRDEYLVRFEGFDRIFKCPLLLPSVGGSDWRVLPEISGAENERVGSRTLFRNIRDAILSLSDPERTVVIVYVPDRWKHWWGYNSPDESFDVHDFTKADCVPRGIATQFLNDHTLNDPDHCRIWWWLSVAIYAKAMRTPWVIDSADQSSAFAGIGYSIDQNAQRGEQIVIGCSHVYSARGQGLQFRLNKIEEPHFRGRNPFLSFDDARRLGETIRTLFWRSHLLLPQRVVIHKLTPFRRDEQEGLMAGLEGIGEIELIEINSEPSLRFVSSDTKGGTPVEGRFPVNRGTVVRLSKNEALLWAHGSTEANNPRFKYYQGKRRIPGPLTIRRYVGTTDLGTLAGEILGLSKMDWNSGDLYSQLPATISSSRHIARIGSLLERFGNESFDYRLFM